jgi:hypothetical protein
MQFEFAAAAGHHLRLIVRSNCHICNSSWRSIVMLPYAFVKKLHLLAFVKIILYTAEDSVNLWYAIIKFQILVYLYLS